MSIVGDTPNSIFHGRLQGLTSPSGQAEANLQKTVGAAVRVLATCIRAQKRA